MINQEEYEILKDLFHYIHWEDEEVKKDKEWLEEQIGELNSTDAFFNESGETYIARAVRIERVYDLINQLDEPEKVVVPKFVADWMEENSTGRYSWWKKIAEWESEVPDKDRKVYDWYAQCNEDTFIIAWITRHYEVEEEPKYNVRFKVRALVGTVGFFLYKQGDKVLAGDNFRAYHPEKDEFRLTEQEIKDYDESCWTFAVPVEEVPND